MKKYELLVDRLIELKDKLDRDWVVHVSYYGSYPREVSAAAKSFYFADVKDIEKVADEVLDDFVIVITADGSDVWVTIDSNELNEEVTEE